MYSLIATTNKVYEQTILYGDTLKDIITAYYEAIDNGLNKSDLIVFYRNNNLQNFKVVAIYDYDVIILKDMSDCFYALDTRKNNSLGVLFKNKSLGAVKTYLHNNYYNLKMIF